LKGESLGEKGPCSSTTRMYALTVTKEGIRWDYADKRNNLQKGAISLLREGFMQEGDSPAKARMENISQIKSEKQMGPSL